MTPDVPIPMRDLLDPTLIPATPALSYVTEIEVAPVPAFPFVHLQSVNNARNDLDVGRY